MAPTHQQILDICQALSEQEQLNATVKEAAKGFCIAGTGAAIGTFLGGPLGMLIGGTLGSVTAAYQSQGKCKSVVDIIKYDMTPAQQRRLANSVRSALQSFSSEDIVMLLPMVLNSDPLKSIAVKEIIRFMTNEMGMAVVRH